MNQKKEKEKEEEGDKEMSDVELGEQLRSTKSKCSVGSTVGSKMPSWSRSFLPSSICQLCP